jgi:hypothetical protein
MFIFCRGAANQKI